MISSISDNRMMYNQDKDVFFSQHSSPLNDTFHLTQSLHRLISHTQSPHHPDIYPWDRDQSKRQSISFLPKIKVSSPISHSFAWDEKQHLRRRKKQNRDQSIRFHQSVAVSRYIENVTKEAQEKKGNKHSQKIQKLVENIESAKENEGNVKSFVENWKVGMKRINKELLEIRRRNQGLDKRIGELVERREKARDDGVSMVGREKELKGYEEFCSEILRTHCESGQRPVVEVMDGSEIVEELEKIQQQCLGESQHIKLIYLSDQKLRKERQVTIDYLGPRKQFLEKQVQELRRREVSILQEIQYLKIEKMKRKNISNVRHPYYSIAPKVIEMGNREMKLLLDSKEDESPIVVLRELELELEEVLRKVGRLREQNESRLNKMEVDLVKNQSHEAYKKRR